MRHREPQCVQPVIHRSSHKTQLGAHAPRVASHFALKGFALTLIACLLGLASTWGVGATNAELVEVSSTKPKLARECADSSHIRVLPGGTLLVGPQDTVTLHGTLEVLNGGTVNVQHSGSLVLRGDLIAGRYRIFALHGGRVLRDREGVITEAFPEWWGAQPASTGTSAMTSSDCTTAIQAAIDFVGIHPDTNHRCTQVPTTVSFGRGWYRCEGFLNVVGDVTLQGAGDTSTILLHDPQFDEYRPDAPHRAFITVEPLRINDNDLRVSDSYSAEFHDLKIVGDYGPPPGNGDIDPPTSVVGIHLSNSSGHVLENIDIVGFRDAALRVSYGAVNSFRNLACDSSGAGVLIEGKSWDLTNWAYWLPASTQSSLPTQSLVNFDSVVANKRDETGSELIHYVGVTGKGEVTHLVVVPQDHAWLSRAVSCGQATCDADHVVEDYAGEPNPPPGESSGCSGDSGATPWLQPVASGLPSLDGCLQGGENVVDVRCMSLGQFEAFDCFCMTDAGRILYAKYGRSGAEESGGQVWNEFLTGPGIHASSDLGLGVSSLSAAYVDFGSDAFTPVQWDRGTQHVVAFSQGFTGSSLVYKYEILHGYRPGWGVAEGGGPYRWYETSSSFPQDAPAPHFGLPGPSIATALLCIDPDEPQNPQKWSETVFLCYRTVESELAILRGQSAVIGNPFVFVEESVDQSGMAISNAPQCVAPQNGRFDVLVVDSAGDVQHRTWTVQGGWTDGWLNVTEHITASEIQPGTWEEATQDEILATRPGPTQAMTVTSSGPNCLDLFVLDQDGKMYRRRYDHHWYDWEEFRGVLSQSAIGTAQIDSVACHSGEVLWVRTSENDQLALKAAHWINSVTTTQLFSDSRFAQNLTGARIEDGSGISFAGLVFEGNDNGVTVDYTSLLSFSACYWARNRRHCIAAGEDGLVRGLSVDPPVIVGGTTYEEARSVFWLDKLISADLSLVNVVNPFACYLSTTPNSYGILYRDIGGGLPVDLEPGYWCYGCSYGWQLPGTPPQPDTCQTYSSSLSLCSRYRYCDPSPCICGVDLVAMPFEVVKDDNLPPNLRNVIVRVRNDGCYDSPSFTVCVSGPLGTAEARVPFLPPGEVKEVSLVQTPSLVFPQSEFVLDVDAFDEVVECNKSNNRAELTVPNVLPPRPGAFSDDFESGGAAVWSYDLITVDSSWSIRDVEDGHALCGEGHSIAIFDEGNDWMDYTLRFRMQLEEGRAHLCFRLTPSGPRYLLSCGEDELHFIKAPNYGDFCVLARSSGVHELGVWHEFEIRVGESVEGSRIQLYVNGELEFSYDDPDPIPRGTIAFEPLENSVLYIDDIEVELAGP